MVKKTSILMVVTNQDKIDAERPTGLWLEEFTIAYQLFLEAGYHISVASPKGRAAAIDPLSRDAVDVEKNKNAIERLQATVPLARLSPSDFDAIYFVGGHGAKYDFPYHPDVDRMVSGFVQAGKVVAAVCHGPAAFLGARLSNGTPLIKGRRLTSFTNDEARALNWGQELPFLLKRGSQYWHLGMAESSICHIIRASLYTNVMWSHLESKLRELGAKFEAAPIWQDHVIVDHKLLTGQNPQSTHSLAKAIIRALSH
jgi:putative intracellular protease/amidase